MGAFQGKKSIYLYLPQRIRSKPFLKCDSMIYCYISVQPYLCVNVFLQFNSFYSAMILESRLSLHTV